MVSDDFFLKPSAYIENIEYIITILSIVILEKADRTYI